MFVQGGSSFMILYKGRVIVLVFGMPAPMMNLLDVDLHGRWKAHFSILLLPTSRLHFGRSIFTTQSQGGFCWPNFYLELLSWLIGLF
jgi:hypothetical protein